MPRTFTDLGPAQQRFMRRALHEGVPLDDPLATQLVKRNPERVTRAQALEARGLIHQRESKKGRRSWRCTDVGRGLVMAHVPVFLHKRGFPSYTHQAHRAMFGEPECVTDYAA
jgi:hypothetical protein